MNMLKPMRLVRRQTETRQEKALREIRERRTGPNVPQGEGVIDNTPLAKIIPVDEVLRGSYRKVDGEK